MPIINLVYKAPSGPSLKTYEEIIAMSVDNALTELNLYPVDYYNKFVSENRFYGYDDDKLQPDARGNYYLYYTNYDNKWHKDYGNASGPS